MRLRAKYLKTADDSPAPKAEFDAGPLLARIGDLESALAKSTALIVKLGAKVEALQVQEKAETDWNFEVEYGPDGEIKAVQARAGAAPEVIPEKDFAAKLYG